MLTGFAQRFLETCGAAGNLNEKKEVNGEEAYQNDQPIPMRSAIVAHDNQNEDNVSEGDNFAEAWKYEEETSQRQPSLILVEELDTFPMLHMASLSKQPMHQAEAALAIADAVENQAMAALICKSPGFEEGVLELLVSDCMDISYPTARLIFTLANFPETKAALANSEIVPIIATKLQSKSTNKHVHHLLVQTLIPLGPSTCCDYVP